MLVLSRRIGEMIQIAEKVWVKVVAVEGKRVRLAIDAPVTVNIRRGELGARHEDAAGGRKGFSHDDLAPISILFVDNEASIRQYCKEEFEREGFRVLLAADGEQVLELLQTTAVDVAVLDEHMPRWSGLETAERIRQLDRSIHIILFTADLSYRSYQNPSVDETVLKAADPAELKTAIFQAVGPRVLARRAGTTAHSLPD
jgi:carbon storage regulator CsrA